MANKGPAYGLSREVQSKIDKKYDPELEERLVEWIMAQCGSSISQPEAGKTGFQNWLKDGCVSVGFLSLYSNIICIMLSIFRGICSCVPVGAVRTHQQPAWSQQANQNRQELRHGV